MYVRYLNFKMRNVNWVFHENGLCLWLSLGLIGHLCNNMDVIILIYMYLYCLVLSGLVCPGLFFWGRVILKKNLLTRLCLIIRLWYKFIDCQFWNKCLQGDHHKLLLLKILNEILFSRKWLPPFRKLSSQGKLEKSQSMGKKLNLSLFSYIFIYMMDLFENLLILVDDNNNIL